MKDSVLNLFYAKILVTLIIITGLTPFAFGQTAAQVARKSFPSVVLLVMEDNHGQPTAFGSGFFVKEDIIATNFHVVEDACRQVNSDNL